MQNSMVIFVFTILARKYPFWENLVQKIEIASLSENVVPTLIRICRSYLFCFSPEILFLGKFGTKKQNRLFKLKSGTKD